MPQSVRRVLSTCLALLFALMLQSCAEIDANLKKAVVIKYAHVANVRMFQATIANSQRQLVGVNPGSFWALFDVCSIDVQGTALTGFNYNVGNFVVDAGGGSYGPGNPDTINVSSVPQSSQSAIVLDAESGSFGLGPRAQFLPRQFYPRLNYRIALFVRENPAGYRGGPLELRYNGQPQVAALVQNLRSENPSFRDFYLPSVSPAIAGTCP